MAFSSDEVNLLVYRYLEEAGFRHSAYTFGYESNVLNVGIDGTAVPRGALLSLLQKGVLFSEAEAFSLLNDGELEARFEKAIGSLNLLECAMCDPTKVRALQRRIQKTEDPQQQQSRVPSRQPPQHQQTEQQQQPSTSLASSNNTLGPGINTSAQGTRPESTSSVKSTLSMGGQQRDSRAQSQQTAANGPQNSAALQQQQQQRVIGAAANYRTSGAAPDYGAGAKQSAACVPQATTSSVVPPPTSNHFNPHSTAQFYQQLAQSISHPSMAEVGTPTLPFSLASNVVSNGALNGPQHQLGFAQQLSALHQQMPHGLKQAAADSAAVVADYAQRYLNGTASPYMGTGAAAASAGTTKKGLGTGNS